MARNRNGERLRSIDIVSLLSPRTAWRLMRGIARAPFDADYAGSPLAVCWFTNFSCNANCHFCCKAREIQTGTTGFPPLSLDKTGELLARIRASVELLYLSGGEPLIHPEIISILEEASKLGFSSVGMSTNLIALDREPGVLELIDAISVSIHSPDPAVHAANLGVPVAVAERVFRNLERVQAYARTGRIKVIVNCVINLQNIDTVLDMVEFTRENGFLLEIVPANDNGNVTEGLFRNPKYESLIDRLVELRNSGKAAHLAGSSHYYRKIRDFTPFRCFPYGVPNIMPDGRLATPCDVSKRYSANVLDFKDLGSAVKSTSGNLSPYPCKEGKCFKAGIIERSKLFGLLVSGGNPDAD